MNPGAQKAMGGVGAGSEESIWLCRMRVNECAILLSVQTAR